MIKKTIRYTSPDAIASLGKAEKRLIYSRFTVDPWDCECKGREKDLLNKASSLNEIQKQAYIESQTPIECKNIKGKTKYNLICPECKEIVAVVHADNEKLGDYANLHYISWHDKIKWNGTYGINVDPHSEKITIECCCFFKGNIKSYLIKKVNK